MLRIVLKINILLTLVMLNIFDYFSENYNRKIQMHSLLNSNAHSFTINVH